MAKIIGIDLGTTNSAMAVINAGEPEIIESSEGRRTVPSVVAINPKTDDDPSVQKDIKRVSFELKKLKNGDAGIDLKGETRPPAEISAMVLRKLKEDAEKKLGEKVDQAVITVPAY